MHLKGRCDVCGIDVELDYKIYGGEFLGSLGPGVNRIVICPKCFKPLVFDVYSAVNNMGMKDHLSSIKDKLSSASNVVVYGIGDNLNFLLRSDVYGLDYEAITGIYSPKPTKYENYLTYPVLTETTLCETKAKCIVCVDDSITSADISTLFESQGHKPPEVIHLTSPEFRKESNRKRCSIFKINQAIKKTFGLGVRDILDALTIKV